MAVDDFRDVPEDTEIPRAGIHDWWVRRFLLRATYNLEVPADWVRFAEDMAFLRDRKEAQIRRTIRHTRWLLALGGFAASIAGSVITAIIVNRMIGK